MTAYRSDLPQRPTGFMKLPIDERGFPTPWFVAFIDGKPDFRVVKPGAIAEAVRRGVCWLCGEPMGIYKVYVIGPMCAVNRVTSEPPCHRDCAEYAVKACPFLTRPMAVRNERGLPEEAQDPAGIFIKRNPGVTALWVTRAPLDLFRAGTGWLFRLGEPRHLIFVREGREATLQETYDSVCSGLPLLAKAAAEDGERGAAELKRQMAIFGKLLAGVYPNDPVTLEEAVA